MTQWAATIYIGKKFVDGFATEAGKDLWAGIKTLGHYIAKNVSKKIEEHRKIALTVTGTEARSAIYVDIAIDIWIPEDNEHVAPVLEAVERVILPLCGCISERNQRLELAPFLIEHDNNWFVSFLGEPSFVIDTGQMEWRLWKSASASNKFVEERAVRCFEACGLQESRDVPFTG
jgi:glycine cleavage system H lipoate-binding protein